MYFRTAHFFLILSVVLSCSGTMYGQNKLLNAEDIISYKELNSILGTNFNRTGLAMHGVTCIFYDDNNTFGCSVGFINFCDSAIAAKELKKSCLSRVSYAESKNSQAQMTAKEVPDVSTYSYYYYATDPSGIIHFTFEFTIKNYLIEVSIDRIQPTKIIPKLSDLYKKILKNFNEL